MKAAFRHLVRATFTSVALIALAACGGGKGSPPPLPPGEITVGGTISGLVGQGLVLRLQRPGDYGGRPTILDRLSISSSGDFLFPTPVPSIGKLDYSVVIEFQPQSPAQPCVVRNAYIATAWANVTDVVVACEEFAYVTHAADNTISAFSVDATTGAIASAGAPVTAGQSPYAIASTCDKKYLYVGNKDSNDVSVFAVDPHSGALTTVPGSPFAAETNPRALALVYCSYLYVANAGSDNLSVYRINQNTGVPAPLSPASYATGSGPWVMAISPYGPFLYTANVGGASDISAFEIATGGLTPKIGSPYPSSSSVSSLAFGASGKFLYAANASGGAATIYGFSVDQGFTGDPNGGALTPLADFPYSLPSCNSIATDQTGTYLYATTGTDVLGYSIDPQNGALSPLSGFPVAVGANADSVSIDPTNQFLYVRSGNVGKVTGFALDAATGALTAMPGSGFTVGASADFFATF